jgi:putative transposase
MGVHRSGFYAWSNNPLSNRRKEDYRLLGLIKESFQASDRIYGSVRMVIPPRRLTALSGRIFSIRGVLHEAF